MNRAVAAGVVLAMGWGCGSPCESRPALRLEVAAVAPLDTLQVQLRVGAETFSRTFDAAAATADNKTSLEIALDIGDLTSGQELVVEVQGLVGAQPVASASATALYQPDACIELSLALSGGRCGDGTLDLGEECDGPQLGQAGCLSRGQRQGDGGVTCNEQCKLVLNCTGGDIDSIDQIQGALSDIRMGLPDRVLAIQAGRYLLNDAVVVDVPGLTITSLGEAAVFGGAIGFIVSADDVTIKNLEFDVVLTAAYLMGDANRFIGNRLTSLNQAAGMWLIVEGDNAQILSNRFLGDASVGIDIQGASNVTVALNVMQGQLTWAIRSVDVQGFQQYDHNTIDLLAGTAFGLGTAGPQTDFCLRNNLVQLTTQSTAYEVAQMVRLRSCGDVSSGDNGVFGTGTDCTGRCNDCRNQGPLCTHVGTADLGADVCLGPASPARDAGRDAGWDLLPDSVEVFTGLAPDLGALEAGGSWRFGSTELSCP